MNFNRHYDKIGKHAMFSPSSWRWINDDQEFFVQRFCSQHATLVGDILHALACRHIKYLIKINKYDKKNLVLELLSNGIPPVVVDRLDIDSIFETFMTYVNDGIGFKMSPEVILYYSDNFFGTADAISYNENTRFLRIHDFKSGVTPAHIEQLEIYAALFCLEYRIKPAELSGTELRIYQRSEVLFHNPEPDEILETSKKIIELDKFLNQLRMEG